MIALVTVACLFTLQLSRTYTSTTLVLWPVFSTTSALQEHTRMSAFLELAAAKSDGGGDGVSQNFE